MQLQVMPAPGAKGACTTLKAPTTALQSHMQPETQGMAGTTHMIAQPHLPDKEGVGVEIDVQGCQILNSGLVRVGDIKQNIPSLYSVLALGGTSLTLDHQLLNADRQAMASTA